MTDTQNNRRLVVSLTSYPARLGTLDQVLATIYAQTRQADEILLWLAREQFPGLEKDLPEALLALVEEKKLTVRWCADLTSASTFPSAAIPPSTRMRCTPATI